MPDINSDLINDEIDNLHIAHINVLQWVANNKRAIDNSMHDKTLRRIGVNFFLEDLRAGTSWVNLKLEEELSQSTDHNNDKLNIWFEKNNDGYLQNILVELVSTGCIEAFRESSAYIFSTLSALCFFYRRPLKISVIAAKDIKHDAEIQTKKYCPKPEKLIKPLASFKAYPFGALFSIYRDGMNSVDLSYRYICFFKIYEAWFDKPDYFFNREKKDSRKITITKKLLASSYRKQFHQDFISKDFDDKYVYDQLNYLRKCLVHPVIDRGVPSSYCNLDSVEHIEAIEAMSNLMERVATKILDTELSLMAKKDKEIKKLLEIYKVNIA